MIGELLHPDRVRVGVEVADKQSALLELALLLTLPEARVNPESVYEVLLQRERLASTGVGSGVAIPHGRCEDFAELRAAVTVCPSGVDFEAVDGLPVQIIVGIVGPRTMPQKHLAALAGVSRVLRDEAKRAALLGAANDPDAYRILIAS